VYIESELRFACDDWGEDQREHVTVGAAAKNTIEGAGFQQALGITIEKVEG
jgi:hypothetical protein